MRWIFRLRSTFGIPFLLLVTSIYWTQGFRSLAWMGVSYQMKDELKLSPSASQFVMSTSLLPWSIKPLYGIFSDCVPIRGRRRIPYLIISSILCFIPWLVLGTTEYLRSSYVWLIMLLTVQNFGAAMADVVVDAMVAETARKEKTEFAGDLQSISWLSMAFGGILGSIIGGVALDKLHVSGIFMLFASFPLVQLLACAFLDDTNLGNGAAKEDLTEKNYLTEESDLMSVTEKEKLTDLTDNLTDGEEDWIKVQRSPSNEEISSKQIDQVDQEQHVDQAPADQHIRRRKRYIPQTAEVAEPEEEKVHDQKMTFKAALVSLLHAVRQPSIFRPMLWFLISQSAVPNLSTIMFYYQTNFLKLDASFLGTTRVVGWAGLMVGTFLYNRYLKRIPLRRIFRWVHIGLAVLTLTDVILVSQLNKHIGIPDKAFVMGASAIGDAVNQFKFMPFLVFSGQICPPGIEGTLFALFMSIHNLGGTISSFTGAALASTLNISSEHFENLSISVLIQAVCTLLPVFLLTLIPEDVTGIAQQ